MEDSQCFKTKLMMAKNQIDYDKRDGKTRVNIKNIHMFLVNDLKSPN